MTRRAPLTRQGPTAPRTRRAPRGVTRAVPAPLRHRDFRLLWTAGLISDTGDWLLLVALPILVYQLTGSTAGTSVAFLVELAPTILLAPLAGRLADRFDRRRTLIAVGACQAVALLPLLAVHDRADLPIVYAVLVVEAALFTVYEPTKGALLPTLVPAGQLVPANSLVGLNQNLGRLVGAPLGGVLLAVGSLTTIVAADLASFLLAIALLTRLRPGATPHARRPAAPPAPASVGRWRRFVGALPPPVRAALVAAGLGGTAQGLFQVLFVVFVARILHGDAAEMGLLRGVQAVGAVLAGLGLGLLTRALSPTRLAAWSAGAFGLGCLAIWNAPWLTGALPVYVVLFALVGAPGVGMMTGLVSAVQDGVPDGLRGRALATFGMVFATGTAAGMVAAGVLGDRLPVVALLDAQGALYLIAGAAVALWPARRRRWRTRGAPATVPAPRAGGSAHHSPAQDDPLGAEQHPQVLARVGRVDDQVGQAALDDAAEAEPLPGPPGAGGQHVRR